MVFAPVPDPVSPGSRMTYRGAGLDHLDPQIPPLDVLRSWYADAQRDHRVVDPAAMVLATVDGDGVPNARLVLLKGLDAAGFMFFTNLNSAKGRELEYSSLAALLFPWHPMFRQIRVRGTVEQLPRQDSERYFQSRPRGSQVAAWASMQSAPLAHREDLVAKVQAVEERFAGHDVLPLPDFWGGLRLRPFEVELWVGKESRLHDRWAWTTPDRAPAPLDDAHRWHGSRRQP